MQLYYMYEYIWSVYVNSFDSILLHSRIISVAMNGFSTRVLEYNPCSARVLFVTEIVLGPIFQVKRFFGGNFLDDPKSEKTKKKWSPFFDASTSTYIIKGKIQKLTKKN